MEFIEGRRVDDLGYLAEHNIDRNKVALELSRIFSRMVHYNGWFHAVSSLSIFWSGSLIKFVPKDPHLGMLQALRGPFELCSHVTCRKSTYTSSRPQLQISV